MRKAATKSKSSVLNTYYNCLKYNPLGYDKKDKMDNYYKILKYFIDKEIKCYVYQVKGKYDIYINGSVQTYNKELFDKILRGE